MIGSRAAKRGTLDARSGHNTLRIDQRFGYSTTVDYRESITTTERTIDTAGCLMDDKWVMCRGNNGGGRRQLAGLAGGSAAG